MELRSGFECKNDKDNFCFICGLVIFKGHISDIDDKIRTLYHAYFKIDPPVPKPWVPNFSCITCRLNLISWSTGARESVGFAKPMRWIEQTNHETDCYFCMTKIPLLSTKKNLNAIEYPSIRSAVRPTPHVEGEPFPVPPGNTRRNMEPTSSLSSSSLSSSSTEASSSGAIQNIYKKPFSQEEFNDLCRDSGLNKEQSEFIGSRLKERGFLDAKITFQRDRNQSLTKYFAKKENLYVCNDIPGLFEELGQKYDSIEWRLFIDSSQSSLKAALIHIGNEKPSIPIGFGPQASENYATMKSLLTAIKYNQHKWLICADLKMIAIVMGLQGGNVKHPCFLCAFDRCANIDQFARTSWPLRADYTVGSENIMNEPLVNRDQILIPPLHIKLGIMTQFIKTLAPESAAMKFILDFYPKISNAKKLAGIFVGPDIRRLLNCSDFEAILETDHKMAWESFRLLVEKFLGNRKDPNYISIVKDFLKNFNKIGARMTVKIHFLNSHLDFFADMILSDYSDEQGERFHQDLSQIENRYKGKDALKMLAEYCWQLYREEKPNQEHCRKSRQKKHF